MSGRLRFNAFQMVAPGHTNPGQWTRPDSRQVEYAKLDTWVTLAKLLERGKFDGLFFADVMGLYDKYRGNRDAAVRQAVQYPINDPSLIVSAMAHATQHLGFAFTQSILQEPPFNFARRVSTLDHLTEGRIGWNIVTSYLDRAAMNLGWGQLPEHDDRYARGDEYTEVLYKLWEASWDDDAVLRDTVRGIYADPAKIHDIDHAGERYEVIGPHMSEPSPQRTPVLFQAGSSERGRDFAARHAEAMFIVARNLRGAKTAIDDIRARTVRNGRHPHDILIFQGLRPIVGGTEEEAQRKLAEIQERISEEGTFALVSGWLGIDLSEYDPDEPIGDLKVNATQGMLKGMIEAAPDKTWTFGDLVRRVSDTRLVGTPEQIADELQLWAQAGIDGVNLGHYTLPGSYEDFIEGVTPVLQERGLQQREYGPGTFREKLTDGESGPRLPDRHPGARYRRAALASA